MYDNVLVKSILSELHPIVAQMSPSGEQAPAILSRGTAVAVTAGAGAGKTRTLVARYLSLLAEGLPLRAIVAITFTKKAAWEMRNRVRDEIRRYRERPDLAMDERERWQTLYRQLDAARIGTIHSLCAEILRMHPAEARVDPRFDMLDEGQANLLLNQVVSETLAWAADDEIAVKLYALLGENSLRAALGALLNKRLEAQAAWLDSSIDLLAYWESALLERQARDMGALLKRPKWADAIVVLKDNQALNDADKIEIQRQLALSALRSPAEPLADRLLALAGLDQINLSGGRQGDWPGGKPQLAAVKAALKTLRELWRDQASVLQLRMLPTDQKLAAHLPMLRAAFDFACGRYTALKKERAALDFDDLEHKALNLLQQNGAVRRRWQAEVQAILVDEFQDTNQRQSDLVKCINGEGGKLFVVGDAKQSIYRFRGADVTVFRAERARIAHEGGATYVLDTSYRAHQALVLGLNDLLRPVLGETQDLQRPWAEPFAPLKPYRQLPGPGLTSPHIELHLAVGSKSGGGLQRAAAALVSRIVALVEGGVQVEEDDRQRPLDYGDIAILCRASTAFGYYEDALEQAHVPFLTVAGRGFYGRPEIRDLLNALQALADPTDDLALAGLLRSPALALSDMALYWLCQEHAGFMWNALEERGEALPAPDGPRAQRAANLIETLHKQVGRLSVADLLKAFLDATDYRAALIQAGEWRSARNVSKLLSDAHASSIVGVGEFLEYIVGLRDSGTREGEARALASGAVQIMSTHAAKGLEFPIVVIGDVTYSRGGRHSLLVDPDLGVLLALKDKNDALPAAYHLGKLHKDDQAQAELKRLFYVAATRAREKLILNGCIGLKKNGTPAKLGGWLGEVSGPLGLDELAVAFDTPTTLHIGQTPVACTIYNPEWTCSPGLTPDEAQIQPAVSLPPPLLAPIRAESELMDERAADQERIPPQRVWRVAPQVARPRAPAWVIGSLVHAALAAWRFPDEDFARWVLARARGYGLTDQRQLADAVRQCRRLLERFQTHALFQAMDAAERRLHEVPYNLQVNGCVESGIIDAMYLQGAVWTIVEFKTDRPKPGERLAGLLAREKYVAQAQRYVLAAERLLGQRPHCVLCMLSFAGDEYVYKVGHG